MSRTPEELTVAEFEELVERTIDKRFEVWLTQLMDAFEGVSDENGDELRPEFAASLRRSLEQARIGERRPSGPLARPSSPNGQRQELGDVLT